MSDVARASGVSRATVSFVLNGTANQTISEATRDRVRLAVAELGYVPHSIARALREGASRIVVLQVGGLPRGHALESFIDGLDEELAAAGHGLLVSYGDRSLESTGTLLEAVSPRAVIDLPALYSRPDRDVADGGWIDGLAAHAMTQVSFLRSRGHLAVAVAEPNRPDPVVALLAGHVRAAARELGMPRPRSVRVGETDTTARRLRAVTQDHRITAVAALTDDLAIAILAAMTDLGLTAPKDLAVIGFDDTRHGALWRPALTTVHIDARAFGRRAARNTLGLPADDTQPTPARVIQRASA
ncbi:LacI family DNA-binding transcriptional regulator [Dactylosporangium sp. NPDC005572]|uniref:LacI family DNA-binding transcriptional regulator n=1 Tax=Dactylosporangium sp. NPDC005572 TaxID=3156889 RepID=UPI0033B28B53